MPCFPMLHRLFRRATVPLQGRRLPLLAGAGLAVLALAAAVTPSLRASEPWEWRDLSQAIPSSVQTSLTLAAGRGEDWLVSTGERLWQVNAQEETADYTDRIRGFGRVQALASDGSAYLLGFQGANGPTLVQTDLRDWTTIDARFPQSRLRDLQGANGRWAIVTEDAFENGSLPRRWQASLLDARVSPFPQSLRLPEGASDLVPGCTKEASGSTLCNSVSRLLPLNGEWYLFGGSMETRDTAGALTQEGGAGVWRWTNDHFERLANAPKARFVSAAWAGRDAILLATTDAVTNPYAADTYWTFDGRTFTAAQNEPLEAGLRSVDTRAIHAAYTGDAWVMTAGKTLIQQHDGAFAVEGTLRDHPRDLAGGTQGRALLIGTRGEFDATAETAPPMPALALLGRKLSTNDASYLLRTEAPRSRAELARVTLVSESGSAIIDSGSSFAVRAEASSQSGIRSIDLLVNGNRVTTCNANTCRYVQTYWNTETTDPREQRVVFSSRATDTLGRVTEGPGLVLLIRKTIAAQPNEPTTEQEGRMPAGLAWSTDTQSGIGIASWITPSSSTPTILNATDTRTVHVAASQASGIDRIEMWVNGTLVRTCAGDTEAGISFCGATLSGSGYPYGSQVLLNARIVSKDGKETWSQGTRFDRF